MIHGGDKEARNLLKAPVKNNVQAFDTKVGRSIIGSHWQTDNILESLYKMQVEKVGKFEILVASLRARDHVRRQERPPLQLQVTGANNIFTTKSRIFVSKREIETRTDLHWELRAKEKRKEKAKTMRKKTRVRRLDTLDHEWPMLFGRSVGIQAWPDQERQRRWTTSCASRTGTPHRNLKGDGNGGDYGGARCTKTYWLKSARESAQTILQKLQERKLSECNFVQLLAGSRMRKTQFSSWMQFQKQVCLQTHS